MPVSAYDEKNRHGTVIREMKRKILIGSIFAALLMLSMPFISTLQAQTADSTSTHVSMSSIIQQTPTILRLNGNGYGPFVCTVLLIIVIVSIVISTGFTIRAIQDAIDDGGMLAFLDAVVAGIWGLDAILYAKLYKDKCMGDTSASECLSCPSI